MSMEALLLISQFAFQDSPKAITKTFIVFVLMGFISAMFSQWHRRRKHSNHTRHAPLPPGPKPWPLLGSLPSMLLLGNSFPKHRWIHDLMNQFNTEIACIRLGNTYVMPVTSPELALEFLKTHDSVFASRSSVSNPITILSRGYLATAFSPLGDQWRKMRRILASEIFNPSTLQRMLPHRTAEADTLLQYIFSITTNDNRLGGALLNLRSITQHFCRNIIRRMIFNTWYYEKGRKDGGPGFEEEEHNQALLKIISHVHSFSISDFMPCLKSFDLDGRT